MDYLKQTDEPTFPKLLWNRPLNRSGAGRLLIVGGHREEFHEVQTLYQLTQAAGIGSCRVVLPDSLRRLLADVADATFVASTSSGSLAKLALGEILDYALNYDALMLGPNLSNNSETSILIESIVQKYDGPIIMGADAMRALSHQPRIYTERANCLLVAGMTEFFTLANSLEIPIQIKDGGLLNKLEIIQSISKHIAASILLIGPDVIVATDDRLSHTKSVSAMNYFITPATAIATVWYVQNPNSPFEGITTAAYIMSQARKHLHEGGDQVLTVGEIERAIAKVMRDDSW